jgi:hypothetical protein
MSGFPTKSFLSALIFFGSVAHGLAQNAPQVSLPPPRDASFVSDPVEPAVAAQGFSGLASQPLAVPHNEEAPAIQSAPALVAPVSAMSLAPVSAEALGIPSPEKFDALMWKGTSRSIAEQLLSITSPTQSFVLNALEKRLLLSAAVPPEGNDASGLGLTALRIKKLIAFGDTPSAWSLTLRTEPKFVDDATFRDVVEAELALDPSSACPQVPGFVQTRTQADLQKALIICQLQSKDNKAAQVSLDVMRSQPKRDDIFLQIADKNILGDSKMFPHQLTPLNAALVALLRLAQISVPGELYNHPDTSLISALLRAPSKEDSAQIGLAERAEQKSIITNDELERVYRAIVFGPEELADPLLANETGGKLRALLYQAASVEKDQNRRIAEVSKFAQSVTPDFLNASGKMLSDMLGILKAEAVASDNALLLARLYMISGQDASARDWLKIARTTASSQDDYEILWPQFVVSGLTSDADFDADLDKYIAALVKPTDVMSETKASRDSVVATLILLQAEDYKVSDKAWAAVWGERTDKHVSFSPLFFDRLQEAAQNGRFAETILLAIDLAGEGEISLPVEVQIIRALRALGLKSEAAVFGRESIAMIGKST